MDCEYYLTLAWMWDSKDVRCPPHRREEYYEKGKGVGRGVGSGEGDAEGVPEGRIGRMGEAGKLGCLDTGGRACGKERDSEDDVDTGTE